ncbi:MAG: hypothetical protein KAW56_16595 [Candidatus Marinimicrobia bacterium]|nr:hypothetical protein [Candidatus Neomarinimicrobiota bacterium]
MSLFILIIGIIAFVVGVLIIIVPKWVLKVGEVFNRILTIDDLIFSRRFIFGILLILAGLYLIYTFIRVF